MDVLDWLLAINCSLAHTHNRPAVALRIFPIADQEQDGDWKIEFCIENLTDQDFSISPIVTATFKVESDVINIPFKVESSNPIIPAMSKVYLIGITDKSTKKPRAPYSFHQVHVTPL
jgi:hypothetical protein